MRSPSRGRSALHESGWVGAWAWSHPTGLLRVRQLSEQRDPSTFGPSAKFLSIKCRFQYFPPLSN